MPSARRDPRRRRMSPPPHQALLYGALGTTRWKNVSPVQIDVLPSPGQSKDVAPDGRPTQQPSTVVMPGHGVPENRGLVTLRTSMFLTPMCGGSKGTSIGLSGVARGTTCRRTR